MITKLQRRKFKKAVGHLYTKRVRAVLDANKVLSKEGKPYSDSTIKAVFIGEFNNEAIESAFDKVYFDVKKEHLIISAD